MRRLLLLIVVASVCNCLIDSQNLIIGKNQVGIFRDVNLGDIATYANGIGQSIDIKLKIVDENSGCPLPTKGVSFL